MAVSDWLGVSPQGTADQGQSRADPGRSGQIQGLRVVDSGSNGVVVTGARRSTAALWLLNVTEGFGMRGCSPDDYRDKAKQREQPGSGGASRSRRNHSPKLLLRPGSSEKRRSRSVMQARAPKCVSRGTETRGIEERKREGQWLTGAAGIPRLLRRLGLNSGEEQQPGGAM